jgi:hypothetical protein
MESTVETTVLHNQGINESVNDAVPTTQSHEVSAFQKVSK